MLWVNTQQRAYTEEEESLMLGSLFPVQPYGLRPSLTLVLYMVAGMFGDGLRPLLHASPCLPQPPIPSLGAVSVHLLLVVVHISILLPFLPVLHLMI